MTVYKVCELWNRIHTDEERDNIHQKLIAMIKDKKFIPFSSEKNNVHYSEYIPNAEETEITVKRFPTEQDAQEYINFVSNLEPISLKIEIENTK